MNETKHSRPGYWVPTAGKRGMTPLHDAAYHNDPEGVAEALADGFSVDIRDDGGWTPLMWSVDMSEAGGEPAQVVAILLAAGASPNAAANNGDTVFMRACERHVEAVFEALVGAGADPNLRSSRSTPLHDAAAAGFDHAIRRLLELGADPAATNRSGEVAQATAEAFGWSESVAILRGWSKAR